VVALTPWVTRLLLANVVMYFVGEAVPGLWRALAFVPGLVLVRPWTALTYMFLHVGFTHLLFNMIVLFFFGPRLELRLGSKSFIWFYLFGGFGGALFHFFLSPGAPMVGASGAVYAVLLGYAYFWPRDVIYLWFVLPVQVWVLTTFLVFASVFLGLAGTGDGVAHFAHLGGLAFGYLYIWIAERRRAARVKPFKQAAPPQGSRFQTPAGRERDALERWKRISRDGLHELNREEIDSLLEKASVQGVASLSADERAFLDRMANQT
jgi:membrane associated rhomboid family serine protease